MAECTYCKVPIEQCKCSWGFDHDKANALIASARSEAELGAGSGQLLYMLAEMLETTMTFDVERRAYYDNFKLVQEDRHKKKEEIAKLRLLLIDALYIIDDCPEHPDKNQHTNAIENLRLEVEKIKV